MLARISSPAWESRFGSSLLQHHLLYQHVQLWIVHWYPSSQSSGLLLLPKNTFWTFGGTSFQQHPKSPSYFRISRRWLEVGREVRSTWWCCRFNFRQKIRQSWRKNDYFFCASIYFWNYQNYNFWPFLNYIRDALNVLISLPTGTSPYCSKENRHQTVVILDRCPWIKLSLNTSCR